jgi:hypothetical protein
VFPFDDANNERVAQPNCVVHDLLVNGITVPFLIATEDIEEKVELAYDYGGAYWDCIERAITADQLKDARQKLEGLEQREKVQWSYNTSAHSHMTT